MSHLLPAIKKYCGYQEIYGADLLESGEKKFQRTIEQVNHSGTPESYTYEVSNFNVESNVFPYSDGVFNIVLCCELIEHLKKDPMHMLWECNRVLKDNGYLILTTPNIASYRALEAILVHCPPYLLPQYNVSDPLDQHYREFAPNEIQMAFEAAGFSVSELDTEDVWTVPNPAIIEMLKAQHINTKLRGDNIFVIARKSSAPKERYPQDLYRGF